MRYRRAAGRAPFDAVEAAAMRAERDPARDLGAASGADIGRVLRRRRGRAREPEPRRRQIAMLGLFELGHQPRDARARMVVVVAPAGIAEMAPRLAPEPRLERRLGEGEMALDVILGARRQRLETLQALQRPLVDEDRIVSGGELGMRRFFPS